MNEREQFYKILPNFLKKQSNVEFTADEVLLYLKKNYAKKFLSSFAVRSWLHKTPMVKKIGTKLVARASGGSQRVNLYVRNR